MQRLVRSKQRRRFCNLAKRLPCCLAVIGALVSSAAGAVQPERTVGDVTSAPAPVAEANDPWVALNRRTFDFNTRLDRGVFAPVTHAYLRGVPAPVRRSLGDVVDNLREPRTCLNDLAQGRLSPAATSASRFVVNSTVGVLGLFDVASRTGLPQHRADFGQTLGRYGVRPGPFVMLPILGPHNVREAVGRLVDAAIDPVGLLVGGLTTEFGATRLAATGLDYRAEADPAIRALDDATDPYVTLRTAYSQRRAFVVREATDEAETLPDFGVEPGQP